MAEIMREALRKEWETLRRTVLRAEMLALLHDIGKLGWPFVGKGCGQLNYAELLQKHGQGVLDSKGKPKKDKDIQLTVVHTVEFLQRNFDGNAALAALQHRLREPLGDWLAGVPGTPLAALGSLLAVHHSGNDFLRERESGLPKVPRSHLIALIMYADTADSLYSKGAETTEHCRQTANIVLTSPFGNAQSEIDKKTLDADAEKLHAALTTLFDGWREWDDKTLLRKRGELQRLLRYYGGRHLAETRLPNNDVSLWQHSSSVAGIFKALLAGCLLQDSWENLWRPGEELAHYRQRLAFLAFRWDTDAYMARSLRSFEVVGRQVKLECLADRLQQLVETELCLGNELYRDRQGICFLVPELTVAENGLAAELRDELHFRMERACNGEIISGELPWSIHMRTCGLQLGDFLPFWNDPGAPLFSGPAQPVWREEWGRQSGRQPQVCPRCGLHAVHEDKGRQGSSDDIACDTCSTLATLGHEALLKLGGELPEGGKDAFLAFLRPDDETGEEEGASSRLALIQGVFSLAALYGVDEPGWSHLLTPQGEDSLRDVAEVEEKWHALQALDDAAEDKDLKGYFASLLGMSPQEFCTQKEGWCGDEVVSQGLKARVTDVVRRLVFRGQDLPDDERQLAVVMLLWGARQHPSPSRLARVWEELGAFTAWASSLGGTGGASPDWLRLPLTRDITSFQILVPASDAWRVVRDIFTGYAQRFGKVRHILPLHVSAGIFRRKAPLYIAMEAARRFRKLADKCAPQLWKLCDSRRGGQSTRLLWCTPDGRQVAWDVPHFLPNTDKNGDPREDVFRTWYFAEQADVPTHLSRLEKDRRYHIWPSTFDFEVLDASVRRYDIHYRKGRRAHYMLRDEQGPRPYPLEIVTDWDRYLNEESGLFKKNDDGKRQRKNAVELLARLHLEWGWGDPRDLASAAGIMARHILGVAMTEQAEDLLPAAADGSFFDLCEWADFITK